VLRQDTIPQNPTPKESESSFGDPGVPPPEPLVAALLQLKHDVSAKLVNQELNA
jgi:hypothetical protein